MSLRTRLERLEKLLQPDGFCCQCMCIVFRYDDEPDPRPARCPRCGRGAGDYPAGQLRTFVVVRAVVYGLKQLHEPADPQTGAILG
jgi:hypothetical protein